MRLITTILATLLLSACDYSVPLVTQPEQTIDSSAIGRWEQTSEGGAGQRLLILPLGEKEYLIAFPAEKATTMYARATHWQEGDIGLVQINWFGTGEGNTPDNNRTYQYARYELGRDRLSVNLLNPEVVSREIDARGALADAIRQHRNVPELFRNPLHFKRIDSEED